MSLFCWKKKKNTDNGSGSQSNVEDFRNEGVIVESKKRKIAVLTSGGDAPGMNAAVRAVVRTAIDKGFEVYGVKKGYNGFFEDESIHGKEERIVKLDLRSVSNIIQCGGTVLYTARCKEFMKPEGVKKAADECRKLGIDGLVVVGGDGSFKGALDLSKNGILCVGIPGTIDNDISCSDYTIGYDTAMNTAMQMVDKLRDTAQAHNRCSIVEVMGRGAGYLAIQTGIAVGATSIMVKEKLDDETDPDEIIEEVVKKINGSAKLGKQHFIIVVAEGFTKDKRVKEKYTLDQIAERIENETGFETRATVLGHVQRGGSPTVRDRVVATKMGYHAIELLEVAFKKADKSAEAASDEIKDMRSESRVVAVRNDIIVSYSMEEALNMSKSVDESIYDIADTVSI